MKKSKIICTLGPACDDVRILRGMMRAGMDVARLNFSHGTTAEHAERIRRVRLLAKQARSAVPILQDLEGHRIRIGKFRGRKFYPLKSGQTVILAKGAHAERSGWIPMDYEGSLAQIAKGTLVYIDDGQIALEVLSSRPRRLKTRVLVGGVLRERKGINIPGFRYPWGGLSAKDERNLLFGLSDSVEYVAQSFVRHPKDVRDLKAFFPKRGKRPKVIAKIENREGLQNLGEILREADAVMVARGDLGVSVPIHQIAVLQKRIIARCRRAGKRVITATQMLESMRENPRPTRAEVTDVANAMIDGSDYLMLSGETAAGADPAGAVRMMRRIIDFTAANWP